MTLKICNSNPKIYKILETTRKIYKICFKICEKTLGMYLFGRAF